MLDPELLSYLDQRFARIDARFERIDARFERIDARFERIDARFTDLEGSLREYIDVRIREVHVLIEHMDTKIQVVADGVIANRQSLDAFRAEVAHQFEEVKAVNRLSYVELERRLTALES